MSIKIYIKTRIFHQGIKDFELEINNKEYIGKSLVYLFFNIIDKTDLNIPDILFSDIYYNENDNYVIIYDTNKKITKSTNNIEFIVVSSYEINNIIRNIKTYNVKEYNKYLKILENINNIIKAAKNNIASKKFDYIEFIQKYPSGGYIFFTYNDNDLLNFVTNLQQYDLFFNILYDISQIDENFTEDIVKYVIEHNKYILLHTMFSTYDQITEIFENIIISENIKLPKNIINMLITLNISNNMSKYIIDYFKETNDITNFMTLSYYAVNSNRMKIINDEINNFNLKKLDKKILMDYNKVE